MIQEIFTHHKVTNNAVAETILFINFMVCNSCSPDDIVVCNLVTVRCGWQPYENYSFEELRYAAPIVRRPSENMLVRANNDGTYSCNWTPCVAAAYSIHVTLDGFQVRTCCVRSTTTV